MLQMFNSGHPLVQLIDCDYKEGGLLIEHVHEGVDLEAQSLKKCLESLFFIWKKPIWIKTKQNKEDKFLCFDEKGYR